jgi:hypothetical protein
MKSGDVRSMYNPVHIVECLNMHMTVAVQTSSVFFFLYSFGSGISVTLLLAQLSILLRLTLIVSMEKFLVHIKIFTGKMLLSFVCHEDILSCFNICCTHGCSRSGINCMRLAFM